MVPSPVTPLVQTSLHTQSTTPGLHCACLFIFRFLSPSILHPPSSIHLHLHLHLHPSIHPFHPSIHLHPSPYPFHSIPFFHSSLHLHLSHLNIPSTLFSAFASIRCTSHKSIYLFILLPASEFQISRFLCASVAIGWQSGNTRMKLLS